jgi:hypothetical protein
MDENRRRTFLDALVVGIVLGLMLWLKATFAVAAFA